MLENELYFLDSNGRIFTDHTILVEADGEVKCCQFDLHLALKSLYKKCGYQPDYR